MSGELVTTLPSVTQHRKYTKRLGFLTLKYLGFYRYGLKEEFRDTASSLGFLSWTDVPFETGSIVGVSKHLLLASSVTRWMKPETTCSSHAPSASVFGLQQLLNAWWLLSLTGTQRYFACRLSHKKSYGFQLSLWCWQATIYLVWTERNTRLHIQIIWSKDSLIRQLDHLFRNKISSIRPSNPHLSSSLMQLWLSTS